jgi:hypothetical protein
MSATNDEEEEGVGGTEISSTYTEIYTINYMQ